MKQISLSMTSVAATPECLIKSLLFMVMYYEKSHVR